MVKTLLLSNQKIYELAVNAINNFHGDIKFPAKAMFYLQKNINLITELGKEIDNARTRVLEHYGKITEDGNTYHIPKENLAEAQKELNDLLALEQEVKIYTVKLDWLGDVELTPTQMAVLEIMIEEEV